MPKKAAPKPERLNFKTSERVRKQLDQLKARTDADTYSEVLRRALAFYDFCSGEVEDGAEVVIRRGEQMQTVPLT